MSFASESFNFRLKALKLKDLMLKNFSKNLLKNLLLSQFSIIFYISDIFNLSMFTIKQSWRWSEYHCLKLNYHLAISIWLTSRLNSTIKVCHSLKLQEFWNTFIWILKNIIWNLFQIINIFSSLLMTLSATFESGFSNSRICMLSLQL